MDYQDSLKTERLIKKYIKKYINKIRTKYGDLDDSEMLKKGFKFSYKHCFTTEERKEFVRQVTNETDENIDIILSNLEKEYQKTNFKSQLHKELLNEYIILA